MFIMWFVCITHSIQWLHYLPRGLIHVWMYIRIRDANSRYYCLINPSRYLLQDFNFWNLSQVVRGTTILSDIKQVWEGFW